MRLGLDPRHCPIDLSKCKAIDSCSVGVATESTVKNSDHIADVLSLQCVLVECKSHALDRNVKWFYGKKELNWYSASSAAFAELEAGTAHVLERVSHRKVGLPEFFAAINWDREVLNQIKKMAREQGEHLHDDSRGQQTAAKFGQHVQWNGSFAKAVQRIDNYMGGSDGNALVRGYGKLPLVKCPIQLGCSDMSEWAQLVVATGPQNDFATSWDMHALAVKLAVVDTSITRLVSDMTSTRRTSGTYLYII